MWENLFLYMLSNRQPLVELAPRYMQKVGSVPLAPDQASAASSSNIHLLKMHLLHLNSDFLLWPDYWAMFSSAVDSHTISLEKVLLSEEHTSTMRGPAAQTVASLSVTADNFVTAVDILVREA